jgi:hypothetical protein
MDELDQIFASDLPDIEKLARAFRSITDTCAGAAENQLEVVRALGDRESVVREQIRCSTLRHAQSIFGDCYRRVTGRRAWDE